MSETERPSITDPQRLRALAHPLRNELLDVLRTRGEVTATQCAEATGESVASCSFHLRMLAKYGFIEPVPREGREKPWRLVVRSITATADFEDPASVHAMHEVSAITIEYEAERLRSWVARSNDEPREWVEASTIATSAVWATAEEMAELSRALGELTDRFTHRWEDPSARPEGARIVRYFGATSVGAEPPASVDMNDEPEQGK